jgi:glycosidase
MTRFDLDGFRLDAVPMMPRAATRRMVRAIHGVSATGTLDSAVLGENFTGPGDSGRAALRTYLGRALDGLDSTFDFPLMWSLREVLGAGAADMRTLEAEVAAGDRAFAGSGAVIGRMVDNHDTARFVTIASGDLTTDPWGRPPAQPATETPYKRALLALTYVLTLPGLPVLYYGDELGLAGANDPDSRRVMPDEAQLAAPQRALLDAVRRLGKLRGCMPAIRRGERRLLHADADRTVALHALAGEADVIVVVSRAADAAVIDVDGLPDGRYVDVLARGQLAITGGRARIETAPLGAAVYVPEENACAN